jgi:glycosyltransferase involved in cell wall biosynthesis
MTIPHLEIAIFSYNRGAYLENCVRSVLRNMPGVAFKVYDDGSDDPITVAYLKSLGDQVAHMKSASDDRHGGYYNNMQVALETCKADYLLMLQDDLQIVRPFQAQDLMHIHTIFESGPRVAFISPLFMKGSKRAYFQQRYQADDALRCYRWLADPQETNKVPQKYADIALLHVNRLREGQWQFASSENDNGVLANTLWDDMVQFAEPWIFYVPEEPAYRGRVLTWGAKLAASMAGNQVKAFRDLSLQETLDFAKRPLSAYPFAEDFVQTIDPKVRKPYKFNVYRTRWISLILNKLELWTRQLFK